MTRGLPENLKPLAHEFFEQHAKLCADFCSKACDLQPNPEPTHLVDMFVGGAMMACGGVIEGAMSTLPDHDADAKVLYGNLSQSYIGLSIMSRLRTVMSQLFAKARGQGNEANSPNEPETRH